MKLSRILTNDRNQYVNKSAKVPRHLLLDNLNIRRNLDR